MPTQVFRHCEAAGLASPSSSSTAARCQQCCPPRRPSVHTKAVSGGSCGHGVFLARAATGARHGVCASAVRGTIITSERSKLGATPNLSSLMMMTLFSFVFSH